MPNHITKIVNVTVGSICVGVSKKHLLQVIEDVDSLYDTGNVITFYNREGIRIGPVYYIGECYSQTPGWMTSVNREGVGTYTPITEDDKMKIKKLISLRIKIVGYDLMKEERGWL